MFVNKGEKGIAGDWNFAYSCSDAQYITIAHQDDIYNPNYLEEMLDALNRANDPILAHSAYYEIRDGKPVYKNRLLTIKKLLLLPFTTRKTWNSIFLRRRSLSFGCGICCPSVTYVKARLPEEPFTVGCKADLDWEAWERLSRMSGEFVYTGKKLMGHRVHEGSTTTEIIGMNLRTIEDLEMLKKFWPEKIAKIINKVYKNAEKSNG